MKKGMKAVLCALFIIGSTPAKAGFFGWLDLAALVIVLRSAERLILEKDQCCACCQGCRKNGMRALMAQGGKKKQAQHKECLEGSTEMVVLLKDCSCRQERQEG